MTSSLPPNLVPARQSRAAFTLVELLVVIGIIVLLIAILLPAVNKAYSNSVRVRMEADLHTISQALEVYHNQFGDYPRPGLASNGVQISGASVLCWALVAPGPEKQDGAGDPSNAANPGPGFRLRAGQGTSYGPYINVDTFKIGNPDASNTVQPSTAGDDYNNVIADRYDHPILYFVANRGQSAATAYVNKYTIGAMPTARFNYNDNAKYLPSGRDNLSTLTLKMMQYRMGDNGAAPANGKIESDETAIDAPYILWSAGPDGQFGPQVNDVNAGANAATLGPGHDDDVTNVPLNDVPQGLTIGP